MHACRLRRRSAAAASSRMMRNTYLLNSSSEHVLVMMVTVAGGGIDNGGGGGGGGDETVSVPSLHLYRWKEHVVRVEPSGCGSRSSASAEIASMCLASSLISSVRTRPSSCFDDSFVET